MKDCPEDFVLDCAKVEPRSALLEGSSHTLRGCDAHNLCVKRICVDDWLLGLDKSSVILVRLFGDESETPYSHYVHSERAQLKSKSLS